MKNLVIFLIILVGALIIGYELKETPSDQTVKSICLDGVQYYWYTHGYLGGLAPVFDRDGKIVLCEPSECQR